MPKYHYKAKNMAGNTIEGVYEAQTKDKRHKYDTAKILLSLGSKGTYRTKRHQ